MDERKSDFISNMNEKLIFFSKMLKKSIFSAKKNKKLVISLNFPIFPHFLWQKKSICQFESEKNDFFDVKMRRKDNFFFHQTV